LDLIFVKLLIIIFC